ncbi:MAG: Gfo/Idh/MocA family oxidoreductase [Planctomycetota bacterium]
MNLTDDQKAIGRDNYNNVVGTTRRGFFKDVLGAGVASGAGLGAMWYRYDKTIGGEPLRVGVIGTGDEGNVLIGATNPEYVQIKAIADIRPYSIHRAFHGDWYSDSALDARPGLIATQGEKYGYGTEEEARKQVKVYDKNYEDLLADPDIEAVIIALPLWLHADAAIKAMRAGKHVLTEKLMAWNVAQCKEMARVAAAENLKLATGHQRHYSILYDNAVDTIRRGVIGDIHHIRAQWHRGNLPGKDSWQPPLPEAMISQRDYDLTMRALDTQGRRDWAAEHKLLNEYFAWKKRTDRPENYGIKTPSEINKWKAKVAQKEAQIADAVLNDKAADYGYEAGSLPSGYQRSAIEELIRWRLWDRTGGGLMAELGSHQLDASGIFISSQFEAKDGKRAKVNPLSVVGVGGRHIFPHDRDVDDHVYCSYEYPGKGYYEDNDPKEGRGNVADANKKVVVTYSSINGNGFGGYGEVVLGTKGTLILEREQETMLYAGSKVDTKVTVNKDNDLVDSYETGGYAAAAAQEVVKDVSRGYTEQIEHWALCIRKEAPAEELHCHPKVALADAVIALTSNIAMAENRRIEFDPNWFDPKSDATPENAIQGKAWTPRKADDIA